MKSQNIVHGILIVTNFIIAANSSLVCDLVDFNAPVLNGLFKNDNALSSFCMRKYEPGMEKLRPESEYYMTFNSTGYMWDQTVEIYELDEYSVIEMGFYFNTKLGEVASYFDLVVISVTDFSTIMKIKLHTKPGWQIIQEIVNTTNVNARIQLYIGATAQMTFMVEYIKISNNHSGAQNCFIDTNTADSIISTILFESTTEYSSTSTENTLPSIPTTSPHFTSAPYTTTQNENHSTRSLDYSGEDSTITSLSDFTTGDSLTIIYDSNTASTMTSDSTVSGISTIHDISSVSTNMTTVITTHATTFLESNIISTDLSNLSSIIPSNSTVDSTTSTSMEFTNHSELSTALTDHGGLTTDSTNGYSASTVYSTIFDISTTPSISLDSTKTTDTTIENSSTVLVDSTPSNSIEFTNHSKPDDILTISLDSTDNVSELPTVVTDHRGLTTDNSSPIIVDSTNDSTIKYSTISDISTIPSTSSKISDTTIDNSSTFGSTILVDSTNSDFLTTPSSVSTNGLTSVTSDSSDFSNSTTILLESTTVETIPYDSTILVNSTIFDYATSSDDSTALHNVSTVSPVSTEGDISTISFDSTNIASILPTDLTDTSVFLTNSTTELGSYLATGDISTIPPTFTNSTGTLDATTVDSTFESAPIYSTTSNISKMPSDSTTSDISTVPSDSTDNISIITSGSQDFSSTILLELTTTDSSIITFERVTVPVDSSTDEISTIPPNSTRNDRTTSDSVIYSFLSTTLVDSTIFVESTTESSNPHFTGTTESESSSNWTEDDSTVTIDSVTENIPSIDHSFSVTLDSTYARSTISSSSTTESSTLDNRSTHPNSFTDQDDSNEMDTTPMIAQHLKSGESHVDVWMVVALLFMSLFCISIFVGLYVWLDIFRLVKSIISPKVNNHQSRNETHINMNDADEERFGTSPITLIPRLMVNRTINDGVWIHKASLSPFDSATSANSFMWQRNRRSEFVV